jgi:hypothetical protein
VFGIIGASNFLLSAIYYEHMKLYGVMASLFSAAGYFTLLLNSYRERAPIHERDGNQVTISDYPILYRLQYLMFACFGLLVLLILLSSFLQN